jgi:TMEM175 potassium channel family protein
MHDTPSAQQIHPHQAELGRRYLERLNLLSDGVFAIAITLSALEIKPEHEPGQTLWQAWAQPLLVYFLGFVLVGGAWVQHRRVMSRLDSIDRIGTALNLVFLSLVALLPIAVRTFLEDPNVGMVVYLAAVGSTYACIALLWAYVALIAKLVPHPHRPHAKAWLFKLLASPMLVAAAFAYVLHRPVIAGLCVVAGVGILLWSRRRLSRAANTPSPVQE